LATLPALIVSLLFFGAALYWFSRRVNIDFTGKE
jgi:hypothetical protein